MNIKLTIPQIATLAYVAMKCSIEIYHPRKGTIPLKRLVQIGFMSLYESSPEEFNHPYKSWTPTSLGLTWLHEHKDEANITMFDHFGYELNEY